MAAKGKPNELIHESSPYLLQHAYNPVNWKPFTDQVLQSARSNRKLLFISIGYSACHWCHVMETECFEDIEIANQLNAHFISIKVDREERPDVDHIYMDALQLMTGSGGWPLNVICLPDGRPFWGATYLPKDRFLAALLQLKRLHEEDLERVLEYAASLSRGLKQMAQIIPESDQPLPINHRHALDQFKEALDPVYGGFKGAPKFMMPNALSYLLHALYLESDAEIEMLVHTSLRRMAYGGINDQVEGGFSRYSVDDRWHVPHFEKMAYDNAQLLSLYAKAYAHFKTPLYKEVVSKTTEFVLSNFIDPITGGCFTAFDADSLNTDGKLEEGAYYTFTVAELKSSLGEDFELVAAVFNVNEFGHWEHGRYVLIRTSDNAQIAKQFSISETEVKQVLERAMLRLKALRASKSAPLKDYKILSSISAMMATGLCHAYRYTEKQPEVKHAATNLLEFIVSRCDAEGKIYRNHTRSISQIDGVLEDYAYCIEALIEGYPLEWNEVYLSTAVRMLGYVQKHFASDRALFYYTSDQCLSLIRRSVDTEDNVISSANATLATCLFKLSALGFGTTFKDQSFEMLKQVQDLIQTYPKHHSCWLQLSLLHNHSFKEVVITGEKAPEWVEQINSTYSPNQISAASVASSNLPVFHGRYVMGQTTIFVCSDGACSLPLHDVNQYLKKA